jgi:hypothetical protein
MLFAPALVASSVLLSACGGSDNDFVFGPTGEIRVIHASKDAPEVDVVLTDTVGGSSTTAVDNLDYSESSGYASVPASTYDVSVQAVLPDGTTPEVIPIPGVDVAEDSRTTAIAVGTVAIEGGTDIPLEAITVADPAVDPAANQVSVTVVHASPTAGAVSVRVDFAGGNAGFDFDYRATVDTSSVVAPLPADIVRIRVALQGDDPVTDSVYDSGDVDLAPYAGQKLLILAVDTTTQIRSDASNGSPIKLLVAADDAASNAVLLDSSTLAGVKIAHISPDAGQVDVTVNGAIAVTALDYLEAALPGPGTSQIPTPANQAYIGLDAGTYSLNVQPTGSGTDVLNPSPSVALTAGEEYSVLALGRVGGTSPNFTLTPTVDSNRPIATQASLKVVHGAPDVPTVDVFAVVGSTDVLLVDDISFGEVTEYLPISVPLTATVEVRDQVGTVRISVPGVTLSAGDVITAIAYQPDEAAPIDPADVGLLLLTN